MNNKLGTELQVAIETPEEIRRKSLDLNTGFNDEDDKWRLIVRYIGNLPEILEDYEITGDALLGEFAIIMADYNQLTKLSEDSRIIFIEKPKSFIQEQSTINGFIPSCMSVPYFDMELRGKGVTVAIIDSGIDIYHPDFYINNIENIKQSKVVGIWDQTLTGNPPIGYNDGSYFNRDDINMYINSTNEFMSRDITGHGTAVAGIVSACTPESDLLIVKLDTRNTNQVDTINLMKGIDFSVRYSRDNNVPMVINLSYGNNGGDHNGNSVIERYIDVVSNLAKLTVVVGAGNDAVSGRHIQINMGNDSFYRRDFQVSQGEGSIYIQIWREITDVVDIILETPSGESLGPFNNYDELMTYVTNNMDFRVLNNGPTPINSRLETYISIIPIDDYLEAGIWSIVFIPKSIIDGRVDVWLPVEGSTNTELYFLNPTETTTITIPSSTTNVITVGAYDSNNLTYASFSGRGYTIDGLIKPDLVAPGVNIDTALVGGGYTTVTGTSFATPIVSSGAAMLMEFGIVRGNDVFLYGEKVKAYLIRGAKKFVEFGNIPNDRVGWGALCVEESIF